MRKIKNIGDVETLPVDVVVREPIDRNFKVLFSHIGRYVIAGRKLRIKKEDVVVDASCGEGYGTYYLSTLCKWASGLDIYKDNIYRAKKYFKANNLEYLLYDDVETLIPNKIVCIETLEHIPKENQNEFILELINMLSFSGDMFVTIPIGNNKPSTYNPFHKNEPSIDAIYNMFIPYFKHIEIEMDSFINSYNQPSTFALVTLLSKKSW